MKVAYAVRRRARSAPLRGRRKDVRRKRYERPERRRNSGQRQLRRGNERNSNRRVQRFKKTVGRRRRQ